MEMRREQPRLKFGIIVRDKHKRQGETRNISVEGCFIERKEGFSELLPVGTSIELLLDFPNAEHMIKVKGVVKHHGTHEDGMGISFESLDESSLAIIEQFIQTFLDDAGDEWAGSRADYWREAERLKKRSTP